MVSAFLWVSRMNIYLIKTKQTAKYDEYNGHVVAALTPLQARKLCPSADEGPIWLSPQTSSCKLIGISNTITTSQVILSSFNAG